MKMERRNEARVAVLISDKIVFKTKAVVRDKGHYIMIKRIIKQRDITLENIYASNLGAPKYVEQILMDVKGEIRRNTVIVGDFDTPLTSMDRSSRKKVNKETAALSDTLGQMDLISSEHFTPKWQNIHTFQVHMESLRGESTC